jgi:hypothetical protein
MKKSMKIKLKKKRLIKTLRKTKKRFINNCNQFLNKKLIFKIKKLNSNLIKELINCLLRKTNPKLMKQKESPKITMILKELAKVLRIG